MYINYDFKKDYLEVLEKKMTSSSVPLRSGVYQIISSADGKVLGHRVEAVSKRLNELELFEPPVKLSILIKMSRIKQQYTQQQLADKLGIGLMAYQNLESGEINPTLKTLLKIKKVLTDINLSIVV